MKPGKLDLPTIWRGCDWGPVVLKWKDQNGDPINLTQWRPVAQTRNIDLNAQKYVNPPPAEVGTTTLSLTRVQTAILRLGVENWDWIFERTNGSYRFPPFLAGKVTIKDPVTRANEQLNGTEPPEILEEVEPPAFEIPV